MRLTLLASFLGLLTLALPLRATATPHYALIAGAPCSTCHVNEQGGGMRTEIGWGSSALNGLVQYEQIGLPWLTDLETNQIADGLLSLGIDARWQAARVGAPSITINAQGQPEAELAPWRVFTMQLQPYLAVQAHESLTLYGTFAMGEGTFKDGDVCWTPYPGQSCWEAMAIWKPFRGGPSLRAGRAQPSVGIRHDDHTMLIRQDISQERRPILPANYAEYGAEIAWQPRYWFRVEAGAWQAAGLAEAVADERVVTDRNAAVNARVTFSPQFGPPRARFSTLLGASTYAAGGFRMDSLFAGIGWRNQLSLLVEQALFHFGADVDRSARAFSTLATWQALDWLQVYSRVELAHAERDDQTWDTTASVSGVRFFPLPWLELRPEYRLVWADRYSTGQYAVQLHLFF
jgi:hypothetical protein